MSTGEKIARSINKEIHEENKIFFTIASNDENNSLLSSSEVALVQLMAAIEARQAHMIQRAQYLTNQKLHSFFDEAPATLNELENNSSVVGAK